MFKKAAINLIAAFFLGKALTLLKTTHTCKSQDSCHTRSKFMKSNAKITINRDRETVFKYTIENVPEWSSVVVSDELIKNVDNYGPGTTYKVITKDRGTEMVFDGLVLINEQPSKHRSIMRGDYFDMDVTYHFEEQEGGTQVRQEAVISPKGLLRIIFFFVGWMMTRGSCRAAQNELNHLKAHLET